ncbi:MAG: hypothetical protein ACK53Y_09235 [bacterium]
MVTPPQQRAPSPSFSQATPSTLSTSRLFTSSPPMSTMTLSTIPASEHCLCTIEQRLDSSPARIDSIKDLCWQLKGSTDMISIKLSQLSSDLTSSSRVHQGGPQSKVAKLS